MLKTLYLIVARGGSKGVPGKNGRVIGGKSLIQWKVEAVRELMKPCDQLIISTDSEELADEAEKHGVDVPFMRPTELATDASSSASVILHALDKMGDFERVMLLEPSSPFTTTASYSRALSLYDLNDADLVVGMRRTEPHTAFIGEQRDDRSVTPIILNMQRYGRHLRRQDFKGEWTFSGALYLFSVDMFQKTHDIYGGVRNYGLLTGRWEGLEIDSMEDLELAEFAHEKGYVSR